MVIKTGNGAFGSVDSYQVLLDDGEKNLWGRSAPTLDLIIHSGPTPADVKAP